MATPFASESVTIEHAGHRFEAIAEVPTAESEHPVVTVIEGYLGGHPVTMDALPWPIVQAATQAALRASRKATEKRRRGPEQFLVRRTYAGSRITYLAHDQGGGQFVDRDDPWVTAFSRTAAEKQVAWQKQRLHWEGDRVRYDLVPIATEATYPNQHDRAALEDALSA